VQQEAAQKLRDLLKVRISEETAPNGRTSFRVHTFDVLNPQNDYERINGSVLNEVLGGVEVANIKLLRKAGLGLPEALTLIQEREQDPDSGGSAVVDVLGGGPLGALGKAIAEKFTRGRFGRTPAPTAATEGGAERLRTAAGRHRPQLGESVGPPDNPQSFEPPEQAQIRRLLEMAQASQRETEEKANKLRSRR